MNPRSTLAIVAAVAVGSAGLGWVLGRQIKSPADLAAEARAPAASLITVPVERKVLSSDIVIRGQVGFSESTDITVSGVSGGSSIITRVPKTEGETLLEGDTVVELAGRPLIALQGDLPAFRSLAPGVEGPDVEQLEEALVRLGLDPGPVDDRYDAATELAVSQLYRDRGYKPNEPTAEDLERVEQARKSVRSAREAVTSAEQAATGGMPRSERLELDRQVTVATTDLEVAKRNRDAANAAAQAAARDAAAALTTARATDVTAAARLAQAEAGTHPDTGVAPLPDELTDLRTERTEAATGLLTADRAAQAANAATIVVAAEQEALVGDAVAALDIATARRAEAIAAAAKGSAGPALSDAKSGLNEAQVALSRLEQEVGVSFPSNELVFLPRLPNAIQSVNATIGAAPQGAVMTVSGSGLRITSSVSAADRSLLAEGAEGLMEDDGLGISAAVRVTKVADSPGGADTAAERYVVWLEPVGELPEEAVNQNLRITIPFESSDGEVLAVPMAALSAGADGSSRVEVERDDGTVELVTVVPGLNARALGLVEITPVAGELEAGDRVVVGSNQPSPNEPDADQGAETDTEPKDGE